MPEDAGGDFIISSHARAQMERRGITEDVVQRILRRPEPHVIVDIDRNPRRVVSVYRTTKLDKSWRNEA